MKDGTAIALGVAGLAASVGSALRAGRAGSRATLAELRARSVASRTETLRAVTETILDDMQGSGWWDGPHSRRVLRTDRPSAWDINCGRCEDWAVEASDRLSQRGAQYSRSAGGEIVDLCALKTELFGIPSDTFEDVSHVVLLLDGRFYDAQDIEGVDDPRQLQVVRGVTREAFLASQQSVRADLRSPQRGA